MKKRTLSNLVVYQKSKQLSQELCVLGKTFPKEEKDSMTNMIKKFSRNINENIIEGWRNRESRNAFINYFMEALLDENDTKTNLRFSFKEKLIDKETCENFLQECEELRSMLLEIINNVNKAENKNINVIDLCKFEEN